MSVYWRNQTPAQVLACRPSWIRCEQDQKTASGRHFKLPGHSLSDLSVVIIQKVKKVTHFIEKPEKNII